MGNAAGIAKAQGRSQERSAIGDKITVVGPSSNGSTGFIGTRGLIVEDDQPRFCYKVQLDNGSGLSWFSADGVAKAATTLYLPEFLGDKRVLVEDGDRYLVDNSSLQASPRLGLSEKQGHARQS